MIFSLHSQYAAAIFFAAAILHTFSVKMFQSIARKFPDGSVGENAFHLLGEVEVVFGIWSGFFILFLAITDGSEICKAYLESRNFTEPAFVFVIMIVCSTRPILLITENAIRFLGRLLPLNKSLGFYMATLILGPLLGSFITEPAAMTVTALILLNQFYKKNVSMKFRYATLGLLFVNISIGGTLTPFAAPPVLMVAAKWNWDLVFMLTHFGWKALLAIVLSTSLIAFRFRREIEKTQAPHTQDATIMKVPYWVIAVHLLALGLVVFFAHSLILFIGVFLFFLGVTNVTKEYQDELRIREALLVGFFLGGLVVLGGMQSWWLQPILTQLSALTLYVGSIALTAVADNAAITYLGSQVPSLSEFSRYALVAGSVVGGGLTVIANAPNPAGFSTLNSTFDVDGISASRLFLSALIPTAIAATCFWFL